MKNETLNANTLGYAAHYDLQFKIPRQPVVRQGVIFKSVEGGIKLLGAPTDKLFQGKFAGDYLIQLINLCDGNRTHEKIASELDISIEAVFRALSLLWASGALEEGDIAPPKVDLPQETICLFSRLGDSTGVNESWVTAVEKLHKLRIQVLGHCPFAEELIKQLGELIPNVGRELDNPTHVVATTTNSDAEGRILSFWESGVPVIYTHLHHSDLIIGPYIDPSFTPCIWCSTVRNKTTKDSNFEDTNLAAGLVTRNLISLFTQATQSYLPMDVMTVDLEDLSYSVHTPATRPGCPECSQATGPISQKIPTATIYEATVAIPPRAYMDLKGHQLHYKPSNLMLQNEFRTWSIGETLNLPKVDLEVLKNRADASENVTNNPLTLSSLALILKLSCGLQDEGDNQEKIRRWTAAGGNIGSVTGFVIIADASIAPLGTYVYQEQNHTLVRLSDEVSAMPDPHAQVTLVMSGNIGKVGKKYHAFALRIAFQDSGCSLATAQLAADNLGIYTKPEQDWDDKSLGAVCATSTSREVITAVLSIGDLHAI